MSDIINAEVQALFDRAYSVLDGSARNDFLAFIGGRVGTMAEGFAREYPPEPNGRPLELFYSVQSTAQQPYKTATGEVRKPGQVYKSKFKSLKQQKKVVMLGKVGKIPTGRTGTLGNSITHVVDVFDGGVLVRVGTNVGYAQAVIGDEGQQNHYHGVTGWEPLTETVSAHVPEYRAEIVSSGQAYLSGYMKGGK